jgi:DNA ligase-associated metallophosphoesterase
MIEDVRLAGERVALLPERALWWPARRTLFVADLHLGKGAAFRALGLPVPEATTAADLARLGSIAARLGPSRLVILGDLLHARAGRSDDVLDAVASWRRAHAALDILLVRGNHDARAGDPPGEWRIECVDGPHAMGPFVLRHEPGEEAGGYALCGHVHPAVRLVGAGGASMRAPCFWLGTRVGVLPSFGSFTGSASIRPAAGDRVFALHAGEIAEVSLLRV